MIDLTKAREEFKRFTNEYDLNNDKIMLKIKHSYRVEEISKIIAESLDLDKEDIELATLIGLLHDIGRFEQIKLHDSFYDYKTINHAILGVQILKQNDYVGEYADKKYWQTIFNAIENHNKLYIQKGLNPYDTMHSKIIRDADKLDIFNIDIRGFKNNTKAEDKYINEKIIKDLKSKKPIKVQDEKYEGDSYLCTLGFVYDLNFDISFKILKEKDYINKIINLMKINCVNEQEDKWLEEIRALINEEIQNRI